jgi:hypothetical protein
MNKIACQYAIVRFAPFVETGEFANIGIIIFSPQNGFFDFKLEIISYGRVTQFFKDIDATIYKKTLYNLKAEMERVKEIFERHRFDKHQKYNNIDFANKLFQEVTRTRESIIRFSKIRTILTKNIDTQLNDLFEYYIKHNFVTKKYTKKYKEILLEEDVRKLLSEAEIEHHFKKDKLGNDAFHVPFPFVNRTNDKQYKIIKPLHLKHDDSTKIYNRGASWIIKINKLITQNLLDSSKILFALSGPKSKGNRRDAYKEIERNLKETGVNIISYEDDKDKILEFAKH